MEKPDLERDILSSDVIKQKCTKYEEYAQNLYAALCNNRFQKNDIWPILKDDIWSCSWRYAGGLIADIRGEGDYLDWYCSGIINESGIAIQSKNDRRHVQESVVTDEIQQDLFDIGWVVLSDEEEY